MMRAPKNHHILWPIRKMFVSLHKQNMTCIIDAPEIHAALLTMETPTICGVEHTNEHKEFKDYCDHADETPSLLGITLGTWAEEELV